MFITEATGFSPGGVVVAGYLALFALQPMWLGGTLAVALATWGLEPITDPRPLFSADILRDEFDDWVQSSHLLKRAFREVAVIGGLVERQHPGKRKTLEANRELHKLLEKVERLKARVRAKVEHPSG